MTTYIILLRGINVSGKNKLPMAQLRDLLNNLGFQNMQTYIQSGNIVLQSDKSKKEISETIKKEIVTQFGYDVPVIIRTIKEWEEVISANPYAIENPKILGFVFLSDIPKETNIEINNTKEDVFTIYKDVIYIHCPSGFGKTKLTNNTFEKKLNVTATTRNYKTVLKLLEMSKC